tara:strand:- start:1240 stop:1707 length:468 start_codon:yes stop_codon:yes gene_type:complete
MQIPFIKFFILDKLLKLGLSPSQMLLANIIGSFAKEDKPLIGGYTTIGKLIGVSPKTAQRDLQVLEDIDLVFIKSGRHKRNANQYNPTSKLKSLYGQFGHTDKVKSTTNTPKGYVTIPGKVNVPSRYSKEYQSDLAGYGSEFASRRLQQRIERDK